MGKLTALSPLVGRWSTTIKMLYPAEQNGQRFRAEDTYRWLPGENILFIYSSDEVGQVQARSFDSGGDVSDFRAKMADGEWRIDGEAQRFASTRLTNDAIEGLWQLQTDGQWQDWMTVSLERQE